MTVTLRLTIEEAENLYRMAAEAWANVEDLTKILPGQHREDIVQAVRVIDKLAASIKRAKAKGSDGQPDGQK